jgi:hypothetical protein
MAMKAWEWLRGSKPATMNAQRFQVGDVVRIIETSPDQQRYLGVICTITSDLFEDGGDLVHALDIEPPPGYRRVCAPPRALELVYDGRRQVSWSDCVWQPRDVELPAFLRPQAG